MLSDLIAKLTQVLETHESYDHDLRVVKQLLYGIDHGLRNQYCECYDLARSAAGAASWECKWHGKVARKNWDIYAFWPDETGQLVFQRVLYVGPVANEP